MTIYIVIEFDFFQPHVISEVHPFMSRRDAVELMKELEWDGIVSKLYTEEVL